VSTLCWSVKGGSGTTVIACSLALLSARARQTLLVDLAGDVAAALGVDVGGAPGVVDWLGAPHADARALAHLGVPVVDGLELVPLGGSDRPAPQDASAWDRLGAAVRDLGAATVVDGGSTGPDPRMPRWPGTSLLVLRPCYLALRRAAHAVTAVDGIVTVREPGRSLGPDDVARVVGAPVVAEVAWDPAVARAVDAGLMAARLPQALARALRAVGSHAGAPS